MQYSVAPMVYHSISVSNDNGWLLSNCMRMDSTSD